MAGFNTLSWNMSPCNGDLQPGRIARGRCCRQSKKLMSRIKEIYSNASSNARWIESLGRSREGAGSAEGCVGDHFAGAGRAALVISWAQRMAWFEASATNDRDTFSCLPRRVTSAQSPTSRATMSS